MLDTTLDIDPVGEGPSETRGDLDVGEGVNDEVGDPSGKTHPCKCVKSPLMVDGVEGLGGV